MAGESPGPPLSQCLPDPTHCPGSQRPVTMPHTPCHTGIFQSLHAPSLQCLPDTTPCPCCAAEAIDVPHAPRHEDMFHRTSQPYGAAGRLSEHGGAAAAAMAAGPLEPEEGEESKNRIKGVARNSAEGSFSFIWPRVSWSRRKARDALQLRVCTVQVSQPPVKPNPLCQHSKYWPLGKPIEVHSICLHLAKQHLRMHAS